MRDHVMTLLVSLAGIPGSIFHFAGTILASSTFHIFGSLVVLGAVAAGGWLIFARLRDCTQHLNELAVSVQDNSRAIVIIRRSLDDALDAISSLQARPHQARPAGESPSNTSTSALRQELETLRDEFLNSSKLQVEVEA